MGISLLYFLTSYFILYSNVYLDKFHEEEFAIAMSEGLTESEAICE